MSRLLTVRHSTRYDYRNPVRFGPHRMAFRPRDSHSMRLLKTGLTITPKPASISWMYDVFGNSIAIAHFDAERCNQLLFVSEITLETFESDPPQMPEPGFPVFYDPDELPDLSPFRAMHRPGDFTQIADWAGQFSKGQMEAMPILRAMMSDIRDHFVYQRRAAEGTQPAAETLQFRSGTCRDFALLMMEGARALGFATRFVTGYVYAPKTGVPRIGGGATHAWAQVYLAGVGWIDFDPTNAIIGNRDLIRVAVARDPGQATPLSGSWTGVPGDYLGMTVSVEVADAARASVA